MPCNRHGKDLFNSMHYFIYEKDVQLVRPFMTFQNDQIHAKSIFTVFCDISLTYITNNVRQKQLYSTYLREKKDVLYEVP